MTERHDSAYRLLFSFPRMVRDLLGGFVPSDWLAGADLASLERRSEARVSDRLHRRDQDMVWRLRRPGTPSWLYLLLEFQSEADPTIGLRLRIYRDLLIQELIREQETSRAGEYPPMMSVMLYNGDAEWSPETPDGWFCWIDVLRAPLPEGENLVSLLCALERSRTAGQIDRSVARLAAQLAGADDLDLRRAFTGSLRRSLLPARFPGAEIPAMDDLEEIRPMLRDTVIGWTHQWLEEGRQKGLEQGLRQGLREGLREGRRQGLREGVQDGRAELLVRQLERKFGPLPAHVRERIAAAGGERLLEWGERLLTARSLAEVFEG
jgi:predicted transposase YdaD